MGDVLFTGEHTIDNRITPLSSLSERTDRKLYSLLPIHTPYRYEWTDTLRPEERESKNLYRTQEIKQIEEKIGDGSKVVIVEGNVGSGKSSTLTELDFDLEKSGVPHAVFSAKKIDTDSTALREVGDQLESYANTTKDPLIVVMDSGDYLAANISTKDSHYAAIPYDRLLDKQIHREPLAPWEQEVKDLYDQKLRLINLFAKPQFRVVTTRHTDWITPDHVSPQKGKTFTPFDAKLYARWVEVFQPEKNGFEISNTLTPEKGLLVLRDHLEDSWSRSSRDTDPGPLFDDTSPSTMEYDRPILTLIAKNPQVTFDVLKRITAEQFLDLEKQLFNTPKGAWEQGVSDFVTTLKAKK